MNDKTKRQIKEICIKRRYDWELIPDKDEIILYAASSPDNRFKFVSPEIIKDFERLKYHIAEITYKQGILKVVLARNKKEVEDLFFEPEQEHEYRHKMRA